MGDSERSMAGTGGGILASLKAISFSIISRIPNTSASKVLIRIVVSSEPGGKVEGVGGLVARV